MKTIKSVEKAFVILDYIADHNGDKNLTEIGNALEMSPATLHGFLATLEELGAIERSGSSNAYSLGSRMLRYSLVGDASHALKRLCQPHLDALRDKTEETAHLAIPEGKRRVLYIQKAESPYPLRLTSLVGTSEDARKSALGYVLYSLEPGEEDAANIELIQEGARTVCIKFEPDLDAYCLATEFSYGANGTEAGISIVVPSARYDRRPREFFTDALASTAGKVENELRATSSSW